MRGSLVLVFLFLTASVTYSLSDLSVHASTFNDPHYESGYKQGCGDASTSGYNALQYPIHMRQGYDDGFSACAGSHTKAPQSQEVSFQTGVGGMDWIKKCNDLQAALVSSCDVLVNPDNTLTSEGERAVGCIRNGIALAGGGSLLLSLPLPLIVAALQVREEPTGCGGIVEWGLIGNADLREIIQVLT